MATKHLDLGCGAVARNPYNRSELHAVDLAAPEGMPSHLFRKANLSLEPIPHPDSTFDSISAFDFLEHIPRVLPTNDGLKTRFPFVELMNEIHRTLKPGGLLYALTPAYPHPASFHDPTHVNTITKGTCGYFCGDPPLARMYGYQGTFTALRNEWAMLPEDFVPGSALGLRRKLRKWRLKRAGRLSHLVWEFACVKGAP
jgi:SAM-dependent methyltransferase